MNYFEQRINEFVSFNKGKIVREKKVKEMKRLRRRKRGERGQGEVKKRKRETTK